MNISVKVEKDKEKPLSRKERRAHRDFVGHLVTTAVQDIDGRLPLPKKLDVQVSTKKVGHTIVARTVDYDDRNIWVFMSNLPTDIQGDEKLATTYGTGILVHELCHIATNFAHSDRQGSGHYLFDSVIDEGKANAVASEVLRQKHDTSIVFFDIQKHVPHSTKVKTMRALAAPQIQPVGIWQRLTTTIDNANIQNFELLSGHHQALYIAGGLICDRFMEVTGKDPFEMHPVGPRKFQFSYQFAAQELAQQKVVVVNPMDLFNE